MSEPTPNPAAVRTSPEQLRPVEVGGLYAHGGGRSDARAIERELIASRKRMVGLAHRLLGWSGDAEDAVQTAFARALRARQQYRGEAAFETWLCRIVINECRRIARWRRVRAWLRLADFDPPGRVLGDAIGNEERNEAVRRALADLPTVYREVVVLRYLQDMSIDRIAEILGKRRGTIDTMLSRAREMLRLPLAEWVSDE